MTVNGYRDGCFDEADELIVQRIRHSCPTFGRSCREAELSAAVEDAAAIAELRRLS